jgi:hypothetical protein
MNGRINCACASSPQRARAYGNGTRQPDAWIVRYRANPVSQWKRATCGSSSFWSDETAANQRARELAAGGWSDVEVQPVYIGDAPAYTSTGERDAIPPIDGGIIEIGSLWRHRGGNLYRIVALARWEPTVDVCVVYRSEENGSVWARPKDVFAERFTFVQEAPDSKAETPYPEESEPRDTVAARIVQLVEEAQSRAINAERKINNTLHAHYTPVDFWDDANEIIEIARRVPANAAPAQRDDAAFRAFDHQLKRPFSPGRDGNNDGVVRDARGIVYADCGGYEGRAAFVAHLLNTYKAPALSAAPLREVESICWKAINGNGDGVDRQPEAASRGRCVVSASVDVSPYRAAWLAFERIAEADGLIDPSTLGPRGEKYLRNRLWRAFAAGWSAAGGDKGSAAAWKDTQAACDESSRAVRSNATPERVSNPASISWRTQKRKQQRNEKARKTLPPPIAP